MSKQFITTPIYYVNDAPHIGHAYTTVAADVLARHKKQNGDEIYLLTGTDEHGAKIAKAAQEKGITPRELADRVSQEFKKNWDNLDIDYSQFFRTTNPKHEQIVGDLLLKIYHNGDIYQGVYEGLYCVSCEEYKKETDLVDGLCPIHKTKPELLKEDVWFFKLSKFSDRVKKLIESNDLTIFPQTRKNEVLSFINSRLEDIAISRSKVDWGIPLPWDKAQTIYVWVEALFNYYTAIQIDNKPELFPPDIQFIGKDILRFHAIIWPALLLAVDLPTPKRLAVHGFFTINNQKMSKSLGNVISPRELINLFGVDATRYLLLAQFPFGNDGDFSIDKLKEQYNADLANGLGNLLQRTLVVAQKLAIKPEVRKQSISCSDADRALQSFKFQESIEAILLIIREANQYIDQEKPWLMPPQSEKAQIVLVSLFSRLHAIATSLEPFMPETSKKIISQLETGQPEPLFPRR